MTSSSGGSVADEVLRLVEADPAALLTLVGPTASGKTALALEIAERLGGEIVGADSVQVYRAFDLGSGKPTPEELALAPHHLIDAIDPTDPIDAASWAARAAAAIDSVRSRGRIPIVCGGTFLWIRALVFGLASTPAASAEVRARHREVAEREGRQALHARLREVDAEIATRLHPNDLVRVSRALEVHELSGRPMSEWQREHAAAEAKRRVRFVAIRREAAAMDRRIEDRVRAWLAEGWIEEVEALIARGYGATRPMGSVGYAQIHAMLRGELPREDLHLAIVRATRLFARRQRTWLNHADVAWIAA
jgi:tRNA dimethylallyltransferase